MEQAPVPGKAITCPNCKVKFAAVAVSGGAETAGNSSRGMWALIALVLAAGVGGIVWHNLSNRDDESVQVAANSNPKSDKAGNPESSLSPSKSAGASPSKDTESASADKNLSKARPENEPIEPQPMPKKTATKKTYAESKRPLVDDALPPPTIPVVPAAAPTVENEHKKKINEAIDKGVAYLKKMQLDTGTWPKLAGNNVLQFSYDVGYAALGGLTLLECQVPPTDPAVQRAAAYVRSHPLVDTGFRTYQASCAILFLDRLGDPRDRAMIQSYALHLVGSQSARGGWGYDFGNLTNGDQQQLLTFLEATRLPTAPVLGKAADPLAPDKSADDDSSKGAADDVVPAKPDSKKAVAAKPKPALPAWQNLSANVKKMPLIYNSYFPKGSAPLSKNDIMMSMMTAEDNSNTQFALLALWAARRHGVPSERCLAAAGARFAASQADDGSWSYSTIGFAAGGTTPAMTCVGLLGLAMGHGVAPPAKKADAGAALPDNLAIARGLQKVGDFVDARSMSNFYFMWSLERVAVLYNLKTIGNQDWYEVGSNMLLPIQKEDGSWYAGGYMGSTYALDTCFALLFLKRSNLVQDLTERLPFLMSISDPAARPNR